MGNIQKISERRFRREGESTDLYTIIDDLRQETNDTNNERIEGLNDEIIAEIYLVMTFKDLEEELLLTSYQSTRTDQLKDEKKKFQEELRYMFFELNHKLDPYVGEDREKILDRYSIEAQELYEELRDDSFQSGTVEYVLCELIKKEIEIEKIGSSIRTGAKEHFLRKPERGGKYKVFKEYNDVVRSLNRLLEQINREEEK
jgi:Skp family chaperone for outer membrane proteins